MANHETELRLHQQVGKIQLGLKTSRDERIDRQMEQRRQGPQSFSVDQAIRNAKDRLRR